MLKTPVKTPQQKNDAAKSKLPQNSTEATPQVDTLQASQLPFQLERAANWFNGPGKSNRGFQTSRTQHILALQSHYGNKAVTRWLEEGKKSIQKEAQRLVGLPSSNLSTIQRSDPPAAPAATDRIKIITDSLADTSPAKYDEAYKLLNGLSMFDMLRTIESLAGAQLTQLSSSEGLAHALKLGEGSRDRMKAAMLAVSQHANKAGSTPELIALSEKLAYEQQTDIAEYLGDADFTQRAKLMATLWDEIKKKTEDSGKLRAELDQLDKPPDDKIAELKKLRAELLPLLWSRIRLLTQAIASPVTTADDKQAYQSQLDDHNAQFGRLGRWEKSEKIKNLNNKLEDATLSNDEKEKLKAERDSLVQQLQGSEFSFKQYDPRWGSQPYLSKGGKKLYNPDKDNPGTFKIATLAAGGCGPSALADVLNFFAQEDPENVQPDGQTLITRAAKFTSEYARGEKSNPDDATKPLAEGTSGDNMSKNLNKVATGLKSFRIEFKQVDTMLEQGKKIIMLKPNHFVAVVGLIKNAKGEKSYRVLDPGGGDRLHKANEIKSNTFWVYEWAY